MSAAAERLSEAAGGRKRQRAGVGGGERQSAAKCGRERPSAAESGYTHHEAGLKYKEPQTTAK